MKDNLTFAELETSSNMRLMEMKLDNQTTKGNDVALTMQFFRDFKLYGLNEAIAYAEGYERDGMYKPSTGTMLRELKTKFIDELENPVGDVGTDDGKFNLDEYAVERLDNAYMRVEGLLQPVGMYSPDGRLVDMAHAEEFAKESKVPIEVAYFYIDYYYTTESKCPELIAKAKELKDNGTVMFEI